ncbi:hypothetical protein TNIN_162031 [Trichonephila inaurata madagascariensis]|uniref:DUF4817 domain-containing protein n=1 Tax=Trichonephila inaurata madagascariensis TaxID=2747483 RepID=A0A8X7BVD6_9ARAC|nr:hypothetical protein TNIN_162031 [Trichonephila inaurata madagascariensis]
MEPYSTKQRLKIIEFFNSCQRSTIMSQRKYRQYFNSRLAPTDFLLRSLVGRFEELSSVVDRPGRGAHRNIRIEDNVETVRQISSRMRMERRKRFPELLTEQ